MPIAHPPSAAANHIQPCSEPEATPPTNAPMLQPKPIRAPHPISRPPIAAAMRERAGGHAVRANGSVAAAAAMAPRIMPKSVRLEVSDRTDSASARFGPGHCQNSAREYHVTWRDSLEVASDHWAVAMPHGGPPDRTFLLWGFCYWGFCF